MPVKTDPSTRAPRNSENGTNGTNGSSTSSLSERVQQGNFEMEYEIRDDGVTIQIRNTHRRETMVTAPNTSPNTPAATGFRPLEERLNPGNTETRTAGTERAGGTNGAGKKNNGTAATSGTDNPYRRSEQAAAPVAAPAAGTPRGAQTPQESYRPRKHLKKVGFGLAGLFALGTLIGIAYHGTRLHDRYFGGGNSAPSAPATAAILIPNDAPDPYGGRSFDELYCEQDQQDLQCVWDGIRDYSNAPAPVKQPEKAPAPVRRASALRLSAIALPAGKGICHRLNDGRLAFQFYKPYQGFGSDKLYVADPEGMRVLPTVVMQSPGLRIEKRDDCSYRQRVQPGIVEQRYNPVRDATATNQVQEATQ